MSDYASAMAELEAIEAEIRIATQRVGSADPAVWRSPAARAYRLRLGVLRGELRHLSWAVDDVRAEVARTLAARVITP